MESLKIVSLICLLSTVAPSLASQQSLQNTQEKMLYKQTKKWMLATGKATRQEWQTIQTACLDTHVLDFLGTQTEQLALIQESPVEILLKRHLHYAPCRGILKKINSRSADKQARLARQHQTLEIEKAIEEQREKEKKGKLAFFRRLLFGAL